MTKIPQTKGWARHSVDSTEPSTTPHFKKFEKILPPPPLHSQSFVLMPFNFGLLWPVSTPGLISTVSEVFCRRRELKDRPRLYLGVSRKAGLRRFTAAPENLSPLLSSKLLCLCVTLRFSRLLHHRQPLMATVFDTPFLPRICLQSVQSVPHRASISPYWVMYAHWICK